MGDDETSTARQGAGEDPADVVLGHGVEAGGDVVQHQHPPGLDDARASPTRCASPPETGASASRVPYPCGIRLMNASARAAAACRATSSAPTLLGPKAIASAKVSPSSTALESVAHRLPQGGPVEAAQRHAVQHHLALVRVEEAPGQGGQYGLAGPGAPDDRDQGPAGNRQPKILQYGAALPPYGDAPELQSAGSVGEALGAVRHRGLGQHLG